MKQNSGDCLLCRLMRSLAFTGLGMGMGAGAAYLLGASRQSMIYSGIVVAALLILGLSGRGKIKKS